jgi:hypothetical protein
VSAASLPALAKTARTGHPQHRWPGNIIKRRATRRDPAVAARSGSRVSIHEGLGVRVSRGTVCSLGQPNKAIGHESQIEPWLAHGPARCFEARRSRTENAEIYGSGPFRGMWSCEHARQGVLPLPAGAGCQRIVSSPAKGKVFSLDIPFYRTRPPSIFR